MNRAFLLLLSLTAFNSSADVIVCHNLASGDSDIESVAIDLQTLTAEIQETGTSYSAIVSELEPQGKGIKANISINNPSGGYSKQTYTIFNVKEFQSDGLGHRIIGGVFVEDGNGDHEVAAIKNGATMNCEKFTASY